MKKMILMVPLLFAMGIFGKDGGNFKTEILLKDKTMITGEVDFSSLPIDTGYGSLEIKLKDVQKIEIGAYLKEESRKKLSQKISELYSSGETAEKAEKEILDMGADAIPYLNRELEKRNYENIEKIYDILARQEQALPAGSSPGLKDKIFMNDDSIFSGSLKINEFSIKTKYGNLKVDKNQVVFILITKEESGNTLLRKDFTLLASKNIAANANQNDSFLDTKIFVKKGERLYIHSTGSVTLASLSNKSFSPNGEMSQGNWMQIPFGAIAGRIGKSGKPFLIGAKFNGKAEETGVLYLTISETVYNMGNSGEFKVTIKK